MKIPFRVHALGRWSWTGRLADKHTKMDRLTYPAITAPPPPLLLALVPGPPISHLSTTTPQRQTIRHRHARHNLPVMLTTCLMKCRFSHWRFAHSLALTVVDCSTHSSDGRPFLYVIPEKIFAHLCQMDFCFRGVVPIGGQLDR